MDLHVVHPDASGQDIDKDGQPDGLYDKKYDCFWFNPNPTWDPAHPDDPKHQPHLDLDDKDGAGPENFNYAISVPGKCYKIGVHYWDDHGWGESFPTVRIFLDGAKVWERKAPKMEKLDLWEVGRVCCAEKDPSKVVEEFTIGGVPVIIKHYFQLEIERSGDPDGLGRHGVRVPLVVDVPGRTDRDGNAEREFFRPDLQGPHPCPFLSQAYRRDDTGSPAGTDLVDLVLPLNELRP